MEYNMTSFRMINGLPHTPANNQKMVFCRETAEGLSPIINEQRKIFFNNRIEEVKDIYSLSQDEIKTIWNLFLAGEHPEYTNGRILEMLPEVEKCTDTPLTNEVSWCFHSFKWVWSLIWKDYQLENYVSLCTRFVLKKAANEKRYSTHEKAQEIFEAELKGAYQRVKDKINIPTRIKKIEELAEDSSLDLFPLDQQAINVISILEKQYNGKFAAEMIDFLKLTPQKYTMQERVESWKQPLFFHKMLAGIVWNDWVKKRIELLDKKPPALTLFTWGAITTPFKTKKLLTKDNIIINENGTEVGKIVIPTSAELSTIDASAIKNILGKNNIELLKSINFHRAFRWQVKEGTSQYINGFPDFRKITINGSFHEFAELIGSSTNKKTVQEIREIIAWQQQATFLLGNGDFGHMLTYDVRTDSKDRRKKILSLYLTDMLLPNFVFSLPSRSQSQREMRMLAPLLDIPPLITNNNKLHAAQAAFQVELCIEMRKRAKEVVSNGGIYLPIEQKLKMAETVGLCSEIINKLFDRWTQDGVDGPKMLDLIATDTYMLSDHHKAAKEFILNAGKMEKLASLRGQKSKKRGERKISKKKN